jgi:DNA-binding CsgD family transcriptional regulator
MQQLSPLHGITDDVHTMLRQITEEFILGHLQIKDEAGIHETSTAVFEADIGGRCLQVCWQCQIVFRPIGITNQGATEAYALQPSGSVQHLSPRELEIARMVALGYPNKTIASLLDISPWTVNTHLKRIFAKLDVTTRAAMVARLMEFMPQNSSQYIADAVKLTCDWPIHAHA